MNLQLSFHAWAEGTFISRSLLRGKATRQRHLPQKHSCSDIFSGSVNVVTAAEAAPRGFSPSKRDTIDLSDIAEVALPRIPDLEGRSAQGRWNPVHMAFLGDAVWELFVRNYFFSPPTKLQAYYDAVQGKVRAEAQALFYEVLTSGPLLSAREREILRWGHNAKVVAPKRFSASGMHIDTYKRATALECLVGYLYLTNMPRLQELVQYLLTIP